MTQLHPPLPHPRSATGQRLPKLAGVLLAAFLAVLATRGYGETTTLLVLSSLLMFGCCWASAIHLLGARAALRLVLLGSCLGWLAEQMGDLEHALSAYENALRHNPMSLSGLTQVAGIARIKENYPKVSFSLSRLPLFPRQIIGTLPLSDLRSGVYFIDSDISLL